MKPVRATFALQFYGELPDDDGDADIRFDDWSDLIVERLNSWTPPDDIMPATFSIIDGDTSPDR